MRKVINKGYTLEVKSWENDGDNSKTLYHTVEDIEEARRLYRICTELFSDGDVGVGNSMEGEGKSKILDYIRNNPELFPGITADYEYGKIRDYLYEIAYKLIGGSEWYDFRFCESVVITHSPDDIYLQEVKF